MMVQKVCRVEDSWKGFCGQSVMLEPILIHSMLYGDEHGRKEMKWGQSAGSHSSDVPGAGWDSRTFQRKIKGSVISVI